MGDMCPCPPPPRIRQCAMPLSLHDSPYHPPNIHLPRRDAADLKHHLPIVGRDVDIDDVMTLHTIHNIVLAILLYCRNTKYRGSP